jgi:hypothetical protein
MENAIYYTFSTIPQVLAALIALVGVFVIFKIQILNKELLGFGKAILDEFERCEKVREKVKQKNKMLESRLKKSINRNDFDGLGIQINEIAEILNTKSLSGVAESYVKSKEFKENLIKKTKTESIFSIIVILMSVVILPFAKIISTNLFCSILIFFIIMLLFGLSLFLIIIIVKESL